MVVRLVKSPVARRTSALAFLALSLATVVASPAAASSASTAGATTPAGTRASGPFLGVTPEAAVLNQKVAQAYTAYQQAREAAAHIGEQTARLTLSAARADAAAARLHREVHTNDGGNLIDVLAGLVGAGESDLDRATEAAENAQHLARLAAAAQTALADATAETERTRLAWERAGRELQQVEAAWTARQAAEASARRAEFRAGYDVDDRAQDRRNRAALDRWQSYLFSLADAAVVPPAAAELADPDQLPRGLDLVRDTRGRAVPGVAETEADRVTVLPSETIRAVSTAFNTVGLVDVPGALTASSYACGGFVANAWGATDTLPEDSVSQWRELRTVPAASLQLGDVVVLGSAKSGLEQSGVYVGRGEVILADTDTGTAGVQELPRRDVYGVKRVQLPATHSHDAPKAGACGVEPPAATPVTGVVTGGPGVGADGPFVLPVAEGAFTLTAEFGATSSLWSSGQHTGLDFAAPTGTPVHAVADGVVSVETNSWAGNLIRIDHGDGVETWYAHLSEVDVTDGQQVRQGQLVGAVGDEGNSTGPHLHFEVRLGGSPVDPALMLGLPGHTG